MEDKRSEIIYIIWLLVFILLLTFIFNACMFKAKADTTDLHENATAAGIYMPKMSQPSQNLMDITDLSDYLNKKAGK